jgi:hypothetical protein
MAAGALSSATREQRPRGGRRRAAGRSRGFRSGGGICAQCRVGRSRRRTGSKGGGAMDGQSREGEERKEREG